MFLDDAQEYLVNFQKQIDEELLFIVYLKSKKSYGQYLHLQPRLSFTRSPQSREPTN